MNGASAWRLEVGRSLAGLYLDAGADAVIAISSAARGTSDRFSDLDLLVIWPDDRLDAARRTVVQQADGTLIRHYPFDEQWRSWGDLYTLGDANGRSHSGLICDVCHMQTADLRAFLKAVSAHHPTDDEHQSAAAMVAYGITLGGEALVAELKSSLRFERALAVALIEKWGVIDHYWRWRGSLERGNNTALAYATLAMAQGRLLRTLYALNRRFFIGEGHLDEAVATLEVVPEGLADALLSTVQRPVAEFAESLRAVIEATFDLVERELPEVDVARLRNIFRFVRTPHEAMPAGLEAQLEAKRNPGVASDVLKR